MKNSKDSLTSHRRGFIGTLAAGAAALGLSTFVNPVKAKAEEFSNALYSGDSPDEWFNQIKGKHKMVFDATQPHMFFPFAWPKVFLMTNEKTGTPAAECSAVVVLRHDAICYAFGDEIWSKYEFGTFFKANDHLTDSPAKRNPFWNAKAEDFNVPGVGPVPIGIKDLQAAGVMFCVCEMAMKVNAAVMATHVEMDEAAILAEWKSAILPGIHPVPSGVWAIGRAQEHGCGYCFTG